jgi:hypothetical protein
MYLNSGELTRIIMADSYWELFKPYFRGKKEVIRTKLDDIGTVRSALAHFRPLKYDDIELIKQNVKHAFVGIEECLAEMTQTTRVVPTNITADWYNTLSKIASNRCELGLFQDRSEQWIRIMITFKSVILQQYGSEDFQSIQLTNLISPSVIKESSVIRSHCTFLTEEPFATVRTGEPASAGKRTSIVFNKTAILENYAEIVRELTQILTKIDTESELIQKDDLARGALVDSARLWATLRTSEKHRWWSTDVDSSLKCEFSENDPTEYWGELGLYPSDFIAGSTKYPWMPSDISEGDSPFDF